MGSESILVFVCVAPIIVAEFIASRINCAIYRYNVWPFRTKLRHGEQQQYVMEAGVLFMWFRYFYGGSPYWILNLTQK